MSSCTIREASLQDGAELARLLEVLGYSLTAEDIAARWGPWCREGNRAVVAERVDGSLAGLATVHQSVMLHRQKPLGRITALVVDDHDQRKGIGRSLVAAAELLLARGGCEFVELTSGPQNEAAHAFYQRLGFSRSGLRFMKRIE